MFFNFTTVAPPLTELPKDGELFTCGPDHQQALENAEEPPRYRQCFDMRRRAF